MKGAVLYATKYGSTAEYANWIGEAADLAVLNVQREVIDLDRYDFLVLVTPVIYYKLLITEWVQKNLPKLEGKSIVMVTVSGAPPGPKLDAWVGDSLPADFIANAKHIAAGTSNSQRAFLVRQGNADNCRLEKPGPCSERGGTERVRLYG